MGFSGRENLISGECGLSIPFLDLMLGEFLCMGLIEFQSGKTNSVIGLRQGRNRFVWGFVCMGTRIMFFWRTGLGEILGYPHLRYCNQRVKS